MYSISSVSIILSNPCIGFIFIYRVSQEECAKLREGVPYVKVCRYNPKHLCPKLNGYGDNGPRKVWSSSGSTDYTYQLRGIISVCPWLPWFILSVLMELALSERAVSTLRHRLPFMCHVQCLELLTTTLRWHASFLYFNFMASCHSQVSLMLRTLLTLQNPHIPASFNIYFVINKCVTPVKVWHFSGHYLRNRSTLDIGVLGYIGIL